MKVSSPGLSLGAIDQPKIQLLDKINSSGYTLRIRRIHKT